MGEAADAMAGGLGHLQPQALSTGINLGPGLDGDWLDSALQALAHCPDIRALIAFGSRAEGRARPDSDLDLAVLSQIPSLTPQQKLDLWRRCNRLITNRPVGIDLVVQGWQDAERLSGSRWHVMRDVAQRGRVLYAAG
jgi:predicted nucleotidyltransferase